MSNSANQGKIAELEFMVQATRRNLLASIPIYDHKGYDLIVEGKKKLYKIQVKATQTIEKDTSSTKKRTGYKINVGHGKNKSTLYKKDTVDFFAFYILEIRQWFIIPHSAVTAKSIRLYPNKPNHKYSKYIEAWWLIK